MFGLAAAFTMLQCPLTLGPQDLPLSVETELDRNASDAGFILGLCAASEAPLPGAQPFRLSG